ncbi:MAG: helix-turn-helix domain-containing protein, partial [Pseudomonadota bacterium]
NLEEMVSRGLFRADLFYRVNQFPIPLAPLRERREDIPELASHFLKRHVAELGSTIKTMSVEMLEEMTAHDWPGNVRELEAHIQRAIIGATGDVLDYRPRSATAMQAAVAPVARVEREAAAQLKSGVDDEFSLEAMQRRHITTALEQCGWIVDGDSGAASVLGLPASSLRSKMKRLGIRRPAA